MSQNSGVFAGLKVIDCASSRKVGVFEHLLFVEPHLFRSLKQDQNVARRFGGNQFIGDLGAKRTKQIEIPYKEGQVSVIGNGVERIYLQGEMPPIFKKLTHDRQRQLAVAQLRHEGAFIDLVVGVFVKRRIEIIDVGFGVWFAELFSGSGLPRLAHLGFLQEQFPDFLCGYHRVLGMSS